MKTLIHNDWQTVLAPVFAGPEYARLHQFLKQEYQTQTVYPEMHHIFQAFEWTPFDQVKVVIFGQDPYHARTRRSGPALPWRQGSRCRPHCRIFIRNSRMTWAIHRSVTGI